MNRFQQLESIDPNFSNSSSKTESTSLGGGELTLIGALLMIGVIASVGFKFFLKP